MRNNEVNCNSIMLSVSDLKNQIYVFRDTQVMLDRDLALIYGVETKRINEAVKNNKEKFPQDFFFELTQDEFEDLRSKKTTTNYSKVRTLPKVFSEKGIYMLATILKSDVATQASIALIRAFSEMRQGLYNLPFERFERIEQRLAEHDKSISTIQKALESTPPSYGIFYDGEIFEAYAFVSELIKKAKARIILIDNYIDESVLVMLSKNPKIQITLYTKTISQQLGLDVNKYNAQYGNLTIKQDKSFHDRFLVVDDEIYHIGASLKDLGKKIFAFSKMRDEDIGLFQRLGI